MDPHTQHVVSRLSDRFWSLIDLARNDWPAFEEALRNMNDRDRLRLYWTYRQALQVLRTPDFERHTAPDLVEDDLYALAAWIVAQGKATYMDIVQHPERIPSDLPDKPYPPGTPMTPLSAIVLAVPQTSPLDSEDEFLE